MYFRVKTQFKKQQLLPTQTPFKTHNHTVNNRVKSLIKAH